MNRSWIYWTCQFLGWGLYTAIGLAFGVGWTSLNRSIAPAYLLSGCAAIAVSHLYRLYIRRHAWMSLRFSAQLPRLVLGSVVFGALAGMLALMIALLSGWRPAPVAAVSVVTSWMGGMLYWSTIY